MPHPPRPDVFWLIRNQHDRALFWSNTQGWVDLAYEDIVAFDDQEKASSNLPFDGEWVNANYLADSPSQAPDLDLRIGASSHSDDHRVEVGFDAIPWFNQATDQEILELAQCEWGGDYPADDVAQYMADQNAELQKMFDYISIVGTARDPVGFECYVDADDARTWLNRHRPHLMPIIARLDEEGEYIEEAQKGYRSRPRENQDPLTKARAMMKVSEVKRWLETLSPDSNIAIDDGGLFLIELDEQGNDTGAYLELGGVPTEIE